MQGIEVAVQSPRDEREGVGDMDALGQWNADRLCDAVRANDVQIVSLCLKHVSPNERETTHFSPLRLAALYGHSQILRVLLDAQATVDERDSGGGTALLKASRAGHLECVEMLLASMAQPNQQTMGFRDTPLMQAAAQGHAQVVECLFAHGADAQVVDIHGRTARELAKHAGQIEVARRLPRQTEERLHPAKASFGSSSTTASTCASPSEARKGCGRPASVGSAPRDAGDFRFSA
jgi:hypothetical protein